MWIFQNIFENSKLTNTAGSQTPRRLHCAELDFEQTNTAQSQQMSFSENPKVANTVRSQSFAVIKFVSAGLSLP